jgi:hypothetical protein
MEHSLEGQLGLNFFFLFSLSSSHELTAHGLNTVWELSSLFGVDALAGTVILSDLFLEWNISIEYLLCLRIIFTALGLILNEWRKLRGKSLVLIEGPSILRLENNECEY